MYQVVVYFEKYDCRRVIDAVNLSHAREIAKGVITKGLWFSEKEGNHVSEVFYPVEQIHKAKIIYVVPTKSEAGNHYGKHKAKELHKDFCKEAAERIKSILDEGTYLSVADLECVIKQEFEKTF